jgi:hypothetical protein
VFSSGFYAGQPAKMAEFLVEMVRTTKGIPHAAWALLPGGHAAYLEDPALWNRTVLDFISQHRLHPAQ